LFQPLTTYIGERGSEYYERAARETPGAWRRYYAELFVEQAPETVWAFFTDFAKWTTWSPVCRGCRLSDERSEVQVGSVLEISSMVFGVTFTVPATVVEFDPPNAITWQGEKLGIQAIHSYRFLSRDGGTLLCNDETFSGVWFPFSALMSPWYRTTRFSRQSLEGIKRELARETNGTSDARASRTGSTDRPEQGIESAA
jgi:ligand-binding SRPBCC domain-containing protein